MKYLNPDRISKRFVFAIGSIIIAVFLLISVILLTFFPIQLHSQEMNANQRWYSKFFVFWPEFLLKQELLERKKLKRYPKSEIQRRLAKQINAMQTLNSPLYDLWLDNNFDTSINPTNIPDTGSFFWPVFPDTNQTTTSSKRQAEFVLFPEYGNIKLKKGFYLGSGESLKSTIPISNAKRFFALEVLPLSTGRIKVALGQYEWAKTFFEADIHKAKKFLIPINDSFTQNYKILNISSSFYILNANVISITSNGRETIYIPNQNALWQQSSSTISSPDNQDPLLEIANPSQFSERNTTLAKGYNVMVLSIDLAFNPLVDKNLFSKLMPNLYKISNQALSLKLISDPTANNHMFDIPSIYKRYGYKTAIFSDANTLMLNDNIASFKEFEKISNSWLTIADAHLQQAINAKNTTKVEDGLNAIFKQQAENQISGIPQKSFKEISQYLEHLSYFINAKNNLFFDSNIIIAKKNYIQTLIETFQKWSLEHKQSRFFVDMTLTTQNSPKSFSIQDVFHILRKTPTFSIKNLNKYLQMHLLDHEFSYIIDALQARHITNRTILLVLFKNKQVSGNSEALLFVPGLQSNAPQRTATLNDLMFYQMSVIGIPVESAVTFEKTFKNFESQQNVTLNFVSENEGKEYQQYHLMIYPSETNCMPFLWKSSGKEIFDVKSNAPFYEISNSNTIQFFPCAFGKKIVEIEWKQEENRTIASNQETNRSLIESHVYGYFVPVNQKALTFDLYCGKNLTNRKMFPINFNHSETQMESLFLIDPKNINYIRKFAIQSFEAMQIDEKLNQNTRVAFFVSRIKK